MRSWHGERREVRGRRGRRDMETEREGTETVLVLVGRDSPGKGREGEAHLRRGAHLGHHAPALVR